MNRQPQARINGEYFLSLFAIFKQISDQNDNLVDYLFKD